MSPTKLQEQLVEEDSLGKIAEEAEAEAWNVYAKTKDTLPKTEVATPKESNATKNASTPRESMKAMLQENSARSAPKPRAPRNREVMLIKNMKSTGAEGEDAVACVTHCRYGNEARHPWRKCIERCIEHNIFHDTFMKMLPAELHAAKPLDEAVPTGLQLPTEEQMRRINHRKNQRKHSAEL